MKLPVGRLRPMVLRFAWCAGPAAAHAFMPPAPASDAPEPEDVRHLRAARAAVARGDLEEALRRFDEAILLTPDLAVAHLGRTICLAALGRPDEAAQSLDSGLHASGQGAQMPFQLSRLAAREGNTPLSMDLLGAALQAEPDLAERVLDDPAYRGMRDHPRLLAMVGRL